MVEISKPKDLGERTFIFAKNVRAFINKLPNTISNREDGKQGIRSSGSVAANYIEANEALSKKDFLMRIKICRKEAKESGLWLKLLDTGQNEALNQERCKLIQESRELVLIFSAILMKSQR